MENMVNIGKVLKNKNIFDSIEESIMKNKRVVQSIKYGKNKSCK